MGVVTFSSPYGNLLRARHVFTPQIAAEAEATAVYFSDFPEASAARRQVYYASSFNERFADMAALTIACKARSLLSVGISYGVPEALLARQYGLTVLGTDYRIGKTQEYAARAAEQGVRIMLWDIGRTALAVPQAFDMIWCCEVLEHLRISPSVVIPELCDAAGSRGKVLITVPNACSMRNLTRLLKGRTFVEPLAVHTRAEHAQGATIFDNWIHVREPGMLDVAEWLRDGSPADWKWHVWMPRPALRLRGKNVRGLIGHGMELFLERLRPTIYALGSVAS